ncbi:rho GTPase-activating protein 45 [Nephila pilipes]|uniref:Rho GTPase-activating protein 45 n=1 Tax=Nephila pilipes TaxID=299642 RepID=A0A8X6QUH0_NEPPI|nr:rho GTPase-activating protein 45 [Nephila pilipes]
MTKLRRSGSVDFGNPSMSNVLDMAKALCLACKQRSKPKRSFSLFQIKSCPSEEVYTVRRVPTQRMEGAAAATPTIPSGDASAAQSRSASGASATSAAARSLSMNSVSSEGSAESHVVEQEDIIVLTHDVRSFKEALGKLRRIFHPERDKTETMRVAAHERLGEVLRILRSILEKYPPIQSTELLMTAGTLIQQVKGYNYEDEKSDPSNFFDAIDQLALAFSSRRKGASYGPKDKAIVAKYGTANELNWEEIYQIKS